MPHYEPFFKLNKRRLMLQLNLLLYFFILISVVEVLMQLLDKK